MKNNRLGPAIMCALASKDRRKKIYDERPTRDRNKYIRNRRNEENSTNAILSIIGKGK